MTANDHTFGLIATSISIPVQVIVLSGGWAWIGVAIMAKAITTHPVIVLCIVQSAVYPRACRVFRSERAVKNAGSAITMAPTRTIWL